jgi:proteasome accessory factor C
MTMPKSSAYNGEDRYNFLLALIGYLQNRGAVSLAEAAKHFGLDEKYIRKAVRSINETTAEVQGFEEWFFMIDVDALDDEGVLSLLDNSVLENVPRLSTRQASAIAAGLNYLSGLSEFTNNQDLIALQKLLADGSGRGTNPLFEIKHGSTEAGAGIIREAIIEGKQISCEYMNQKGERSSRVLEPLRLDPRSDGWYLRAYCPLHKQLRNFKLDRMRAIVKSKEPLSKAALAIPRIKDELYIADAQDTTVTVEVTPEAYRLISEFKNVSEPTTVDAGVIRAEIKVGHLPNIGRLVARYGGAARVITPEAAKKYVREYALKALGSLPQTTINDED